MWESEENQRKSVALWKKIAERYKDSPWIGGYDIINEPNYGFTGKNLNGCDEESNAPLRKFMVDVTKAIREVDQKHLIIIEGNCWEITIKEYSRYGITIWYLVSINTGIKMTRTQLSKCWSTATSTMCLSGWERVVRTPMCGLQKP